MEFKLGGQSSMTSSQLPDGVNQILGLQEICLMAIIMGNGLIRLKWQLEGPKGLVNIDKRIEEPPKKDPNYFDWESETYWSWIIQWKRILLQASVIVTQEGNFGSKFRLLMPIKKQFRIFELTKEVAAFKQGDLFIGN